MRNLIISELTPIKSMSLGVLLDTNYVMYSPWRDPVECTYTICVQKHDNINILFYNNKERRQRLRNIYKLQVKTKEKKAAVEKYL